MLKKGLSDAMFLTVMDMETFLAEVQKAGYDGVELNYFTEGGALNAETTSADLKSLKSLSHQYQVEFGSLTTGLLNNFPISSGNKSLREKGIEIASQMINFAASLEIDVVQLVPGVATTDTLYGDSYKYAQESLALLGDQAAKSGITIGIENVVNKFLPSAGEYSAFLRELNHPAVKAYFDNGNALATGYIEDFIDLIGDEIIAIHFKDYRAVSNDFVSLLDGDTNWPALMKSLDDISYQGYIYGTPPYPYTYGHKRIIHQYYEDLTTVMNVTKETIDL